MLLLLLFSQKSLFSFLPVDNVPNSLEVVSLDVLVLQVVGVLPCVDGEQRHQRTLDGILIVGLYNVQGVVFLVLDEESPSRTLNTCQFGVGHFDQVVKRAVLRNNLLGKLGRVCWQLSTSLLWRREVFPEKTVICVSTAMEVHVLQELEGSLDVTLVQCLGVLLRGLVVTVDVRLMVLCVVELVNLTRDVWLQGSKVPVKFWQRNFGSDG